MTTEQVKAIQSLQRAFKKCKKADLRFTGMDGSLLYATRDAIKNIEISKYDQLNGQYPLVAEVYQNDTLNENCGELNTFGTYEDSGGW